MKFNREKSKQFSLIESKEKKKAEQFGKVVLTSFGIMLILFGSSLIESKQSNKPLQYVNNSDKSQVNISDYDIERGKYLERVHKYMGEFTDRKLLDFYKEGKLIVNYNGNKIESNLKALYLRYGYINNNKFIFLSNVLKGRNVDFFTSVDNYYAENYSIIEFRNTTLFEKLYEKYSLRITDNTITLDEKETLELISLIYTWDGKINDMVPETMAVENKQAWEEVSSGKER